MRQKWILLTLGCLSKRFDKEHGLESRTNCTTYKPLLFSIVNTESGASYKDLFTAAQRVSQMVAGVDLSKHVGQLRRRSAPLLTRGRKGGIAARLDETCFANTANIVILTDHWASAQDGSPT